MATLEFCDKHNMVAYLEKPEGSAEFHQIIDFLTASHIHYALTENPTIYTSFIKQFWTTATASTTVNGEVELTASIDGQAKTITEASLRRHLKLEDNGGISSLPNTEIFEQLALMGYATDSDKLTFQKGNFSPQWRFFIHTILHCLSPKKTSWEQFSSNIATAIICLATNRTFNFSKFIFDAMVKNLDNPHKFLMYPRFIQICLNKQRRLLQPHTRTYPTPVLTQKVFSNMKRVTRGYSGEDIPLFPSMITAPETSPSRITSSPSLSPQHTPVSAPSTSPPPITETTPTAEEPALMPHESPLQSVQSLGRDEGSLSLHELTVLCTNLSNKVTSLEAELAQTKQTYGTALTKLIKKVKKLEQTVKISQSRRRTRVEKSDDTEVLLEEEETAELIEEPTELVEDQGSGKKGEQEVTTADTALNTSSVPISTVSATPEVSTTAANLVYIERVQRRGKIKGLKAIISLLSFMEFLGFIKMDVKSAFLYGTIDEEVYVSQPPGLIDPKFPKKVYKVVKALYGLHQAPKAWFQCKKQKIMTTSTTEAEYVAAANCCGQNPVFHSKTKHIKIRHHFIRDAYEKKLIQVLKIHTDDNVADLLTKAFDVSRQKVSTARPKLSTARQKLVPLGYR
ncbi:putative ribonuclease H-like domain-containing protein [Tanacetum coccineum]